MQACRDYGIYRTLVNLCIHFTRKNGWRSPQGLIIGTPISQYASYSAMFCPLHSNISKERHEKYLCNPSSHYKKHREYARETCAPQGLIIGTPISQYTSNSVMFCPLHSNISKEQHENHLCNPCSHYRKYGEYARETRAPYLDT